MKLCMLVMLAFTCSIAYAQDCDELQRRSGAHVFPTSYAADLDGIDDKIVCADHNDFSFTNGSGQDQPFSLFIWMNRANSTSNHILISKLPDEYLLSINGTTLQLLCIQFFTTRIGRTAPMSVTGNWIGIAATYDGTESSNGIKLYSVTTSGQVTRIDNANLNNNNYQGMINANANLVIGNSHTSTCCWFEGKLSAPMVVNKELTQSELIEIATAQNGDYRKVSFYNNIVSAWHFPNGQNDYPTYVDYKSGRNGTLTNMQSSDILLETP